MFNIELFQQSNARSHSRSLGYSLSFRRSLNVIGWFSDTWAWPIALVRYASIA